AEINRSLIGKWGPEGKMRVEFGKIREFARAVKEDNPLYFDEALCLAPPTFLMTMALWIGGLGESRSAVKLDLPRVLHGEQEFEYVKPIHGGDVLTFRSRTKEVFEKEGKRGGNMLFVVGETDSPRLSRGDAVPDGARRSAGHRLLQARIRRDGTDAHAGGGRRASHARRDPHR
ncbi:MAG: MaoC family dehydratase, partial [Deltaproteobacteria bacterium]